jgi:hypothetical protein
VGPLVSVDGHLATFSTVLGLMLVSLARLAVASKASARSTMQEFAGIEATLLRTSTGKMGRGPTVMVAPALSRAPDQAACGLSPSLRAR